jgi:hypothetical protein
VAWGIVASEIVTMTPALHSRSVVRIVFRIAGSDPERGSST